MSITCPKCGQDLQVPNGTSGVTVRCSACGYVDSRVASADSDAENTNATKSPTTARFDYHLKAADEPLPEPPESEPVPHLSMLNKSWNSESDQLRKKRIMVGTIGGGILVAVILVRIATELFKEYARQEQEKAKVRQVEWNDDHQRPAEKLIRPAAERKEGAGPSDELPDDW